MRGKLIVIEGNDRCGKTTTCKQLVAELTAAGISAEYYNYPDRKTPIGKIIDEYLRSKDSVLDDHAVHLLFSANRWETKQKLEDKLNAGINIILDRYIYSGLAYSLAKGLSVDWCTSDNGLLVPDVVVHLTSAEYYEGFGEERYETTELQEKVKQKYSEVYRMLGVDCKSIEYVKLLFGF